MKKARRGYTLVELISAIMIAGMIGVITTIIFNIMFTSQGLIDREATIQADMRTSMQMVDKTIEKATAVFILDDSKYQPNKANLSKEWSYIGLSEDGKKVLNYVWNKDKKDWNVQELGVKSLYGLTLDLTFKPDDKYQDNRLVKYNLTGKYNDSNNKLGIDTAITALNTKQVFSRVGEGKKGIAIAYRNDPIKGQVNTAVSFVFDTSGSMGGSLLGRYANPPSSSRMNILKTKTKKLVEELADIGNVSVNLVQFSTLGSYVQEDFLDVTTNKQEIFTKIDSLESKGYTNPGDGLRYGLVSLQNYSAQMKYVVLLTDGVPNVRTIAAGHGREIRLYGRDGVYRGLKYEPQEEDLSTNVGDKASKAHHFFSNGNEPLEEAIHYPGHVAGRLGSGVKRVNFIGFSGVPADKKHGQQITDGIRKGGLDAVYTDVSDEAGLEKTFADIKKQIEQDKWFVTGP